MSTNITVDKTTDKCIKDTIERIKYIHSHSKSLSHSAIRLAIQFFDYTLLTSPSVSLRKLSIIYVSYLILIYTSSPRYTYDLHTHLPLLCRSSFVYLSLKANYTDSCLSHLEKRFSDCNLGMREDVLFNYGVRIAENDSENEEERGGRDCIMTPNVYRVLDNLENDKFIQCLPDPIDTFIFLYKRTNPEDTFEIQTRNKNGNEENLRENSIELKIGKQKDIKKTKNRFSFTVVGSVKNSLISMDESLHNRINVKYDQKIENLASPVHLIDYKHEIFKRSTKIKSFGASPRKLSYYGSLSKADVPKGSRNSVKVTTCKFSFIDTTQTLNERKMERRGSRIYSRRTESTLLGSPFKKENQPEGDDKNNISKDMDNNYINMVPIKDNRIKFNFVSEKRIRLTAKNYKLKEERQTEVVGQINRTAGGIKACAKRSQISDIRIDSPIRILIPSLSKKPTNLLAKYSKYI